MTFENSKTAFENAKTRFEGAKTQVESGKTRMLKPLRKALISHFSTFKRGISF
jgi:hypothetical protein